MKAFCHGAIIAEMETIDHRKELIHIVHMAYSGELAAGIAYAGHWRSLRDPAQRACIQKIENEEVLPAVIRSGILN
ncbi:MAG TPA: hypothetical protein V6D17_20425 [Candidatus Obscuribacterales bacterium]